MKARRVVEDVHVPVQIVAAPPATVTQRTCLDLFGLSKNDYLRLAGTAFPVKMEGKLRVARYADVESYLTTGAAWRGGPRPKPTKPVDPVEAFDVDGALHKAGFRPS